MKPNKEKDLVEIFAGSSLEAEIVKSLLKDCEIDSFLKDENMGSIAPWHTTPGGIGAVTVIISNSDYAKAKLVVEEFNKNSNK